MNDGTQPVVIPQTVPIAAPPQGQHERNAGVRMSDGGQEYELRRARDEAADYRTKLREAERERDAALQQITTLQSEIESIKASTADLTTKLTEAEAAKAEAAATLQAIAEKRHAEALERLPEEKREAVKTWTTEQIELVAAEFLTIENPATEPDPVATPAGSQGAGGASDKTDYAGMNPLLMTDEQMTKLKTENPELYTMKLRELRTGQAPTGVQQLGGVG